LARRPTVLWPPVGMLEGLKPSGRGPRGPEDFVILENLEKFTALMLLMQGPQGVRPSAWAQVLHCIINHDALLPHCFIALGAGFTRACFIVSLFQRFQCFIALMFKPTVRGPPWVGLGPRPREGRAKALTGWRSCGFNPQGSPGGRGRRPGRILGKTQDKPEVTPPPGTGNRAGEPSRASLGPVASGVKPGI
jgi:hypothetical protein